ncbi:MAG: DUF2924 domain-containing protein [Planctomycetota bacterium]|jgi:hypothetical protein|nr:DUF2924 domain-containing protein [Planctomycetota bacterium]
MVVNMGKEVAALKRMTVAELRGRYAEVTGEETRCRHKDYLVRRIAWRLQANEEGDISERARKRAEELAYGTDVRITSPREKPVAKAGPTKVGSIQVSQDDRLPMPGAVIVREYKGETIEVHVLPDGFEYEGEVYRTLSAVAKKVTGTHWNGYHFFRLGKKGGGDDQPEE